MRQNINNATLELLQRERFEPLPQHSCYQNKNIIMTYQVLHSEGAVVEPAREAGAIRHSPDAASSVNLRHNHQHPRRALTKLIVNPFQLL